MEMYADLRTTHAHIDVKQIRNILSRLRKADGDTLRADYFTRKHYLQEKPFVWISRQGVSTSAEQLLAALDSLPEMGFAPAKFRVAQIKRDLETVRAYAFTQEQPANLLLARLEYNLTKAFLRYAMGQRFGFTNPNTLFNRLDTLEGTTGKRVFRRLYDIRTESPDTAFIQMAFEKVRRQELNAFWNDIRPQSNVYARLQAALQRTAAPAERLKLLCNMERCRWRQEDAPHLHQKYLWVNIPSFDLVTFDADSVLAMRMACGTLQTKTPLLISRIERMDVNPQWVMPQSIIKKQVVPHAGNARYFETNRYFVRELATGKTVDVRSVSAEMLLSGKYRVVQQGGEGNALGRIIFRFRNNFSVFLHDTSSRSAFSRFDRGVSHGCIRVEKPFELAVFLLPDKDETLIDKISYSMTAPLNAPVTEQSDASQSIDRKRLVYSQKINPSVPLFITYYTVYPDASGTLQRYPDVYGYDKVMARYLENYF